MTWITKTGKEMEISEMTDSHLLNAIKYVERRAKEGIGVCGGQYYGEGECDYWEETVSGKEARDLMDYGELKTEAKKRGLNIGS
jgi:hypothetical protein